MSTAILIHGCHLGAKGWENIVWGDPQNGVLGRVPRGIQLAFRENAELIFWGTGASERDGTREAMYTFLYAVARTKELLEFSGMSREESESFLRDISFIDTESQTTLQEVERAIGVCLVRKINKLVLVSSPTHVRGLVEADSFRLENKIKGLEVWRTSSDTCFADSTPKDVLIVEPPHRGDRPEVPIHKTLRRAMRLGRGELAEQFNTSLDAFLRGWEGDL